MNHHYRSYEFEGELVVDNQEIDLVAFGLNRMEWESFRTPFYLDLEVISWVEKFELLLQFLMKRYHFVRSADAQRMGSPRLRNFDSKIVLQNTVSSHVIESTYVEENSIHVPTQ